MTIRDEDRRQLEGVAKNTLDVISRIADDAEAAIAERPLDGAALVRNTFTDQNALRTVGYYNEDRLRDFQLLADEPAIARVVARDDRGVTAVYFVTRSITPNRTPPGCKVTSGHARIGRLASGKAGEDIEIDLPGGTRIFHVLERALLRPARTEQYWDCKDTVLEGAYPTVTIASLRSLLDIPRSVDEDEVAVILAREEATRIVFEGIRKSAIQKIGLRDQPILDKFQDSIFRQPLDKQLLLLGPPGTGKTTTLIRRLAQKLSAYLDDREQSLLDAAGTRSDHAQSWLMFTPTELLRQYVKEAFGHERVPVTDEQIKTWSDYRHDIARTRFGILKTANGSGTFIMRDALYILGADSLSREKDWFADFFAWQATAFWDILLETATALAGFTDAKVAAIGKRLQALVAERNADGEGAVFVAIAALSDEIRAIADSMKKESDGVIRKSLNVAIRSQPKFLEQLGQHLVTPADDPADAEDDDAVEEDDPRPTGMGAAAVIASYERSVRVRARAEATRRSVSRTSRNARILDWLGDRIPPVDDLFALGANLQVQDALRHFLTPMNRYVNGIPSRYRRFRRVRQNEGKWYEAGGFAASDISPLEIDIVILSMLRTSSTLLKDRTIASDAENPRYASLQPARTLARNQIMVDEVTDFSAVQLACMGAMAHPRIKSFFACGDFHQRITSWGIRSEDDLRWSFPQIDIRTIETTYRHSQQLNDLAKALIRCSSGDKGRAVLPDRVDNDMVRPVLATELADTEVKVAWLASRIAEIDALNLELPSVAVLVNSEEEVAALAKPLERALEPYNIRAVPCPNGQVRGQDSAVRIFDVRHVKGLEFEAVFFLGVDELAAQMPDLFDKYIYVGATRAATYLGLTCSGPGLPERIAPLVTHFAVDWHEARLRG